MGEFFVLSKRMSGINQCSINNRVQGRFFFFPFVLAPRQRNPKGIVKGNGTGEAAIDVWLKKRGESFVDGWESGRRWYRKLAKTDRGDAEKRSLEDDCRRMCSWRVRRRM